MKRIPHAQEVGRTLRAVETALKQARKGVSQVAAELMAKGDFDGAAALVARGREIQHFETEVKALRQRWRELRRGQVAGGSKASAAQWHFYRPILKALVAVGGEARRGELEPHVESLMQDTLRPGDHETMARGLKRWQVMVRRARKHLASEGWIEDRAGSTWRITSAGRRAADEPLVAGSE